MTESDRGASVSSTSGNPPESAGSIPASRSDPELYLEVCSAGNPTYVDIRSRHYVVPKGTHGQQVHFLVWYRGSCVGIISGASAVYATASRDVFFKLTQGPQHRQKCLNGIIDNVVFRLEYRDGVNHLPAKILLLWEKSVAHVWEQLYDVPVFGFETFILTDGLLRERELDGQFDELRRPKRACYVVSDPENFHRRGGTYRGAGWTHVGQTSGNTKGHDGVGLTGGKRTEINPIWVGSSDEDMRNFGADPNLDRYLPKGYFLRKDVPIKEVYCKWVPGISTPIESNYQSSWKASTAEGTPEEKAIAKLRSERRRALLGTRFYFDGKALVYENVKQAIRGRVERNASGASGKTRIRKMRQSTRASSERENLRETTAI